MRLVDLSRHPFLNLRPVRRVAATLWVLGLVLLVVNVWLFGSYLRGSARIRAELAKTEAELADEGRALEAQRNEAQGVPIEDLNQRSEFLNLRLASRAFPWSRLFGDLEEVLPLDVWLQRVEPDVQLESEPDRGSSRLRRTVRRRGRSSQGPRTADGLPPLAQVDDTTGIVRLTLVGISAGEEPLLDFVDRLFAHPSFGRPLLSRESLETDGSRVRFNLTVPYTTEPPSAEELDAWRPEDGQIAIADGIAGVGDPAAGGATDDPAGSRVEVAGTSSGLGPASGGNQPPRPSTGGESSLTERDDETVRTVPTDPRQPIPGGSTSRAASDDPGAEPADRAAGTRGTPRAGGVPTPPAFVPGTGTARPAPGASSTPAEAAPPASSPGARSEPERPTRTRPPRRVPTRRPPPPTRRPTAPRDDASSTARLAPPPSLVEDLFGREVSR